MSQTLRLLLVDDDAEDAAIFRRRAPANLLVQYAPSYREGLEVLSRGGCDIAFIDYRLGIESGLELIREARARRARVPLVLITGQDVESLGENALLAGATDFVPKDNLDGPTIQRTVRWSLIRRLVENRLEASAAQAMTSAA